jgi:hypothetical protein
MHGAAGREYSLHCILLCIDSAPNLPNTELIEFGMHLLQQIGYPQDENIEITDFSEIPSFLNTSKIISKIIDTIPEFGSQIDIPLFSNYVHGAISSSDLMILGNVINGFSHILKSLLAKSISPEELILLSNFVVLHLNKECPSPAFESALELICLMIDTFQTSADYYIKKIKPHQILLSSVKILSNDPENPIYDCSNQIHNAEGLLNMIHKLLLRLDQNSCFSYFQLLDWFLFAKIFNTGKCFDQILDISVVSFVDPGIVEKARRAKFFRSLYIKLPLFDFSQILLLYTVFSTIFATMADPHFTLRFIKIGFLDAFSDAVDNRNMQICQSIHKIVGKMISIVTPTGSPVIDDLHELYAKVSTTLSDMI